MLELDPPVIDQTKIPLAGMSPRYDEKQLRINQRTKNRTGFALGSAPVSKEEGGENFLKYTLVIVDEYSRYTWVFFLRSKSDAPEEIILFVRKMEKLNNLSVRSIRSDHGTEFKNSTLETFFDRKGISQNFSSVRTPQQNGVAERRNRTRIEAARSMLSEANLATQFWAEAVNTVCYTQNRSLIVKRFRRTPYELFHNRKPSIEHLHIFGCFDSKSDDGIFLGYSSISKTYRVFNKRRQTIEETIHVRFDESGPTFSHPQDNAEINQWADSFFRQDWTGQDWTGLDRTGQDRTGQESRTGQDWTEQMFVLCLLMLMVMVGASVVVGGNTSDDGGGGGGRWLWRMRRWWVVVVVVAVEMDSCKGGRWWW
ncbi:hypothetical protein OSB04_002062 [Centaurea solstitialis]|uniref:Integrase catalytic domain-containing protein n=1 Tax=Centaurea solstitialis TaxID=347529 RepID=A0AA38U2S1_9ASTR|nr:hypothetical protein OSB04_002062 [Centaurea solstitialis]